MQHVTPAIVTNAAVEQMLGIVLSPCKSDIRSADWNFEFVRSLETGSSSPPSCRRRKGNLVPGVITGSPSSWGI
jgi:hypothetical protein